MNNKITSNKSETDWERIDAMTDEDIDLSDCPEITPQQFARAVVRKDLLLNFNKDRVMPIDSDILEWFKSQGDDYQNQINNLLRAYMEANH